jgi:hypothetical protein
VGQVGGRGLLTERNVPDSRAEAQVLVVAQRARYRCGGDRPGHDLGQGRHVVESFPEPAADHRAGGVRGVAGQRRPSKGQSP